MREEKSRGNGQKGRITERHEETLGAMDMFIVFIVVTVSWIYIYVSIYQIVHYIHSLMFVCCTTCIIKRGSIILLL